MSIKKPAWSKTDQIVKKQEREEKWLVSGDSTPNFLADHAELIYVTLISGLCSFETISHQWGERVVLWPNYKFSYFCLPRSWELQWGVDFASAALRCGRLSHALRDCLVITQTCTPSHPRPVCSPSDRMTTLEDFSLPVDLLNNLGLFASLSALPQRAVQVV